ncbi:MAG: site-2 protease family protein [Candidatus Omnitrophica bacterium]|nr:site-2 protease family protein [Candidatus Omnitrophota bacterium]
MRAAVKLFTILGIEIKVHVTFLLLIFFVMLGGIKWVALVFGVFFFVTMHEICHSVVAKHFGIKVREITLLPIGGIASMSRMPDKPYQEFWISLAGPASNILVVLILFFPMKFLLGPEVLLHPLSTETWPLTMAYVFWINLILAGFNMIPAFPMDGGRVLRSLLAIWLGYVKATRIAALLGHIFAFAFAYFGIMRGNIILVAIAVFVYMAASGEEAQVNIKEILKRYRVYDILPRDFLTVTSETSLGKVLEMIFHSHQEDFPVVDGPDLVGFITRKDIMTAVHSSGVGAKVEAAMRKSFPKIKDTDTLIKAHKAMSDTGLRALPVMKGDKVAGVITIEDVSKAYAMVALRG